MDVRKDKNVILRLYQLLSSNDHFHLTELIRNDMKTILVFLRYDASFDLKSLGIKSTKMDKIISDHRMIHL